MDAKVLEFTLVEASVNYGIRMIPVTWRVGGVSKQLYYRVMSTITPIRIPFRVSITLRTTYLVSPPTLQVGHS